MVFLIAKSGQYRGDTLAGSAESIRCTNLRSVAALATLDRKPHPQKIQNDAKYMYEAPHLPRRLSASKKKTTSAALSQASHPSPRAALLILLFYHLSMYLTYVASSVSRSEGDI